MKVLVLNGSPKGEKSNTLNITKAFLDGFSADTEVEYITVKKETIKPCMGCFSCWSRTPGKCVIKDDMQKIYEKINSADIIIESFPLYFFRYAVTDESINRQMSAVYAPLFGKCCRGQRSLFP